MNKVLCFIAFLIGACVYGQIQVHPTVKKGIEKAIEKNKSLENKRLSNEKDVLTKEGVQNKYLPKIELKGAYAYTMGNINIDVPTKAVPLPQPLPPVALFDDDITFENSAQVFHTSLMAKSVIFSGFQIPNARKALEQKIAGNRYLIEADKEKIIKEVLTSFDQLELLREAKKVIENSEKRLEKEQLRVNKAVNLGLAVPYDRDKIELAKLELASKKITVNGNEDVLIEKINYLTGLSTEEIKAVDFDLTPSYLLDENLSIQTRKELKALEAYKKAKEFMVKKEKGSFLPNVGVFMGVNYSGMFNAEAKTTLPGLQVNPANPALQPLLPYLQPLMPYLPLLAQERQVNLKLDNITMQPMFMAGVGLKWTIFDGLERKHALEIAEIEKHKIENKLSDTKEKLGLLLKNTQQKHETENAKLKVAYQQEKIAQNNLTRAEKQYKLGLISVTERLASENEFLKAKMNIVKSLVSQRLSAVEVLMATGKLSTKIETK